VSGTRLKDFYETEKEFEAVYEAAEENCRSEGEQSFLDDLNHKVTKYGLETFFSERQNIWLKQIAER
jgi:hypothetical protein